MSEREWTGSVSNLPAGIRNLAIAMSDRGSERIDSADERSDVDRELIELRAWLQDHAYSLSEWADAVEQLYARLDEGEVVTNAQGVSLARFLRSHFRADPLTNATVTLGGMGLSTDYLLVRMADGYTGGIAQNGDTST